MSKAVPAVALALLCGVVACSDAESSCSEWPNRMIGTALSVALPDDAVSTTSFATADAGPNAPFFLSVTFEVDGNEVGIGRQRGEKIWPGMRLVGDGANPPPEQVSQLTTQGVTLFVASTDDELRTCVFESLRYDPTADRGV